MKAHSKIICCSLREPRNSKTAVGSDGCRNSFIAWLCFSSFTDNNPRTSPRVSSGKIVNGSRRLDEAHSIPVGVIESNGHDDLRVRCAQVHPDGTTENMSEARDWSAEQLDSSFSDEMLDSDIIDISAVNFGNNDTWLQPSPRNASDCKVRDLQAWMKADIEQDCSGSHDNRRSIDTRTFTRPKKRSGRLSFESIVEVPSPTSPNVWKPQCSPSMEMQANEEDAEPVQQRRESTPPMLRPSNPGVSGLCSADTTMTSGQASLEAFLNMSQSKGIDSFINLAEPEFNDAIMNTSQPSILYSSMMSTTTRDELSQTLSQPAWMNQSQVINQSSIEDSQILTESMMQTSMFGDVTDVNFNDTFAKGTDGVALLENTSFYSSDDRTFVATPMSQLKAPMDSTFDTAVFNSEDMNSMDATYTPDMLNTTLTNDLPLPNDPHASYIVNHKCQTPDTKLAVIDASFVVRKDTVSDTSFVVRKDTVSDTSFVVRKDTVNEASFIVKKETASDASYVVREDVASDASFVVRKDIASDASFVVRKDIASDASFVVRTNKADDETFVATADQDIADDATFKLNASHPDDQNDTFKVHQSDATFETILSRSPRKLSQDSTFRALRGSSDKLSMKLNVPKATDPDDVIENFDATFKRTPASSPHKSAINSTFKAPTTVHTDNDHAVSATLKAPANPKMDQTYDNSNDYCNKVPLTNRYNTYRKGGPLERARNENYATNNLTAKPPETAKIGASLENLDATFDKPVQKVARKLNAPRALSRLPQSLQKSNPNLISNSLKAVNTVPRSAIPSFGYRKNAPPGATRNVESSLTSKLYGLGKIKSGSEQRLEVTRNATDFQITGTGGSTESIDSTQSAHSAPDFDDRLSVCSDSSHNSYSRRTMTIEDLQKATHMRDNFLKPGSTPKPSRRVLENNWVDASKDLPSPILKNGPETYGSRGSSPRSTDSTVKTSSPLMLSPAGSLQNLTINVTHSVGQNNADETKLLSPRNEHNAAKRISEATVKPARSAGEHRTGLRPPASWSSANQRPASGIPRPASRIPAPRFARPPTKTSQGGTKKGGCL